MVGCAGDQQQQGALEGDDEYAEQGEEGENYADDEAPDEGGNNAGGDANYGENGGDEGAGQNNGGQQQGINQGNSADFGDQGGQNYGGGDQQENPLSNSYQTAEGEGAEINNTTQDSYAMDQAANAQMPAVDAGQDGMMEGGAAPMQETATYMPGDIPEGWVRTQNGLFIPITSLSAEPVGYEEPPAMWQ